MRERLNVPDIGDLQTFKTTLESMRASHQTWGRNHNVGFHIVWVLGAVVTIFAIAGDFSGKIGRGTSIIGMVGGAILAIPAAFDMKGKSLWYFDYARKIQSILFRLGSGELDHPHAVKEYDHLSEAMAKIWAGLTRGIDFKRVIQGLHGRGI
jgi:hypothetical protein